MIGDNGGRRNDLEFSFGAKRRSKDRVEENSDSGVA